MVRMGAALAYDPMQRQLDEDGINLFIEADDIAAYRRGLEEVFKLPKGPKQTDFIRMSFEDPKKSVDTSWMVDKTSRMGPRFKDYITNFMNASVAGSIEVTGHSRFAQDTFDGAHHVYFPIARKLEAIRMRQQFGL